MFKAGGESMNLIAIDLDGTMLSGKGTISHNNREAVRRAQAEGNIVVIVSGRAFQDIIEILKDAKLECPIIAANGALIYHDGRVIQNLYLDGNTVKDLLKISEKLGIYYELYTNKGIYQLENEKMNIMKEISSLRKKDPAFSEHKANQMMVTQYKQKGIINVLDKQEILLEKSLAVTKFFMISFDLEKHKWLERELEKRADLTVIKSDIQKFEIAHPKVSKGNALQAFANFIGIPLNRVTAIGDNLNDISMFCVSGTSIAMGNAVEAIKNIATYITKSCDEDGVAYGIQHYIIQKDK